MEDLNMKENIFEYKSNDIKNDELVINVPECIFTIDDFFTIAHYIFQFPSYFGRNWDAFEECIRDYHWLETERRIVIKHDCLPEIREDIKLYLEILYDAVLYWRDVEKRGDDYSFLKHKFRVVFPVECKEKINEILNS